MKLFGGRSDGSHTPHGSAQPQTGKTGLRRARTPLIVLG